MIVVFSMLSPRFLLPNNLSLIAQQVMVVGTLAIGQTIIILTAGIDLSVGAIMLLATVSMGRISAELGGSRRAGPGHRLRHRARPAAC